MLNFNILITITLILFASPISSQDCPKHGNLVFNNEKVEQLLEKYVDSFISLKKYDFYNKDSINYFINVLIEDTVLMNGQSKTIIVMLGEDYSLAKYNAENTFFGFKFYKDIYLIFYDNSKAYRKLMQVKNPHLFLKTKCDKAKYKLAYNENTPIIQLEFIDGKINFGKITYSNFLIIDKDVRIN